MAALTSAELLSKLTSLAASPSTSLLSIRGTPTCLSLAALLRATHEDVPIAATPPDATTAALIRQHFPDAHISPPGFASSAAARFTAAHSLTLSRPNVLLPTTLLDAAAAGLGLASGARAPPPARGRALDLLRARPCALREASDVLPRAEMLPPSVVRAVRPLVGVPLARVDALAAEMGFAGGEVARAKGMLGKVGLAEAAAHAERRDDAREALRVAADALLRDAVVDVNHWGYAVVCRETLGRAYADSHGGREMACDVLARLLMHVTGGARELSFDSMVVTRIAEELLGARSELPPGRTVAGVLIRPASGPSADAFHRQHQRRKGQRVAPRRRPRGDSAGATPYGIGDVQTRRDLLVLSREPDRETAHLTSVRMGGNLSAVPIPTAPDTAVYWDNRFVLAAAPATDVSTDRPMLSDESVLLAALQPDAQNEDAFTDAEFYVRQLRHTDWEYITSESSRARSFRAPYQCIRGLPAIYQKHRGDNQPGVLAAVPHLGLSGRPDMVFTAVRLPRFRCIPPDLEPGFQVIPHSLAGTAEGGDPLAGELGEDRDSTRSQGRRRTA